MRINKRQILNQLVKKDLWENLSSKEIRLYLLLIVTADSKGGKGELSLQEVNRYLEISLNGLKRTICGLQKLHLAKVNHCDEWSFQFQLVCPADQKKRKQNAKRGKNPA
ncbi:hypothetical protein IBX65_03845 [Candidatus Aerophobetes bacterium]|nr:hypothetical protein [Candidatus Aerophobetes bacterium]